MNAIADSGGTSARTPRGKTIAAALFGGAMLGIVVTGILVRVFLPGMMIQVKESSLGFDETVAALEEAIVDHGWVSPGTSDMQQSLAKQGRPVPYRVKLVKLCHPEYAKRVLDAERHVSCLMPCTIAVWEGDDEKVYISKMNTGLMGTMFGGTIAEVMGGSVAKDEEAMLAGIVKP